MRDITALLRVHEFFFVSQDGAGCRVADFEQLKKLYPFGELVTEIHKALTFAEQSEDRRELLILPALAYNYLHAYLHYEKNSLEEIDRASSIWVHDFEKKTAPKWWHFLIGGLNPPESAQELCGSPEERGGFKLGTANH